MVQAEILHAQAGAMFVAAGENMAVPGLKYTSSGNPAAVVTENELGFLVRNRFTGTQLVQGAVAYAASFRHSSAGISANYSGTGFLNSQRIFFSLGQALNPSFRIGCSAGVHSIWQGAEYGRKTQLAGTIACQYTATKTTEVGLAISNPWAIPQNNDLNAAAIHAAVAINISKGTQLCVQYRQQAGSSGIPGIGLVFSRKQFTCRSTLQTGYEPICAGIEFHSKNLVFAMAGAYHIYLGLSPSFSLLFSP